MQNIGKYLLILLMFSTTSIGLAQELDCNVVINADQIQTSDRRVFDDMQKAFAQFLNGRQWSQDEFRNEERISCNLVITLQSMPQIGQFTGTVQIQSARPVYASSYNSLIFNFADREWQFQYVESQPLDFAENAFISNLTSMLAFYAYMIVGIDYDSYGEMGGTPYFEKAWEVVTLAQTTEQPGWKPFENSNRRNRYWLAEAYINQQFQGIRKGLYQYHRQGLDLMAAEPEKARENGLLLIEELQKANRITPNNIFVISILDAKRDEIISLYSQGDINLRRKAFNILSVIDPTNSGEYEQMIRN